MKAIILTYDKNRVLTEHMMLKYKQLWPNHPFRFHIPYQRVKGEDPNECLYIKTPVDIKGTVLRLLEGLDDEEWIYWCIDDKYPLFLDIAKIVQVMNWALYSSPDQCSGVLFCRIRDVLTGKALQQNWLGRDIQCRDKYRNTYLLRKNYEQIWLHQFIRVKVIRYLFENLPEPIQNAKQMDSSKYKVNLPQSHSLWVTQDNLAVFGESTSRGEITANCYESLVQNQLELPELVIDKNTRIILGETDNPISFSRKFQLWNQNLSRNRRSVKRLNEFIGMFLSK